MNLNRAMIIGNLTRDPEVRSTPSGAAVTSFAIATNYVWTDPSGNKQEKVEFHNIVAWRKLAEICGQYLHKGSKVYVEGRLQTRSWDDQTGNKRYITEIVIDNMIMLDSKGMGGRPNAGQSTPLPEESTPTIQVEEADLGPTEEIKVEEVPF